MSDKVNQLAQMLIAARRSGTRITSLPESLIPASIPEALAVQHAVAATIGPIGGWKVGAPGGNRVCGALPAATVQSSPAVLDAAKHPLRCVESEICFAVSADLPPRASPYSRAEVMAALGTMHAAIEVCESRYGEPNDFNLFTNLADTQSHGGLVDGPGRSDWQGIDMTTEVCDQMVNGARDGGRTGYPFGDIIDLVCWLANEGSVWAGGLKAGQVVTCGSWSGANRVPAGATVAAKFGSFAPVEISYK
jgi:2-keto-4-pentenoate hydratase